MATTHSHPHPADHAKQVRTYAIVLAALLVLTVITVAASRVDFGSLNVIIALGIATVKGSLVALYFMHLRHDKPMNAIIFLMSLLFLALFLGGTLSDVQSRWDVQPANLKAPAPQTAPGDPQAVPPVAAPAPTAKPAH